MGKIGEIYRGIKGIIRIPKILSRHLYRLLGEENIKIQGGSPEKSLSLRELLKPEGLLPRFSTILSVGENSYQLPDGDIVPGFNVEPAKAIPLKDPQTQKIIGYYLEVPSRGFFFNVKGEEIGYINLGKGETINNVGVTGGRTIFFSLMSLGQVEPIPKYQLPHFDTDRDRFFIEVLVLEDKSGQIIGQFPEEANFEKETQKVMLFDRRIHNKPSLIFSR